MEAILGPLFPLSFFALLALEPWLSPRRQPKVRHWTRKGIAFFLLGALLNGLIPAIVAPWLSAWAPFDLHGLGLVGGAVVVILATTFVDYWVHRLMHRSQFLWRWMHQLHHSAERVDLAGFAVAHPFELVVAVLMATVVGSILGVSADAVVLGGFVYFATQLFLHLEIDTPAWIGWFLQRPEGHRVHHTRGVHAYNYGLPLWDALFGTRRNPDVWDATYGFWDGASRRTGAMLLGRDITRPQTTA